MVLQSTISRGKNLRSILNKVLIQINAKCGGIPWSVSGLPFLDQATMVVGYDVHHKRGQKSLLALCATINQQANKYWSKVVEQDVGEEIAKNLRQVLTEAILAFSTATKGAKPKQIIFYRDGVGDS